MEPKPEIEELLLSTSLHPLDFGLMRALPATFPVSSNFEIKLFRVFLSNA